MIPSKKEKSWISIEYPCVIVMTSGGFRCGYVGVPENHPLYGVNYNETTHKLAGYIERVFNVREVSLNELMDSLGPMVIFSASLSGDFYKPEVTVKTHKGLTYSNSYCPGTVFENHWWFGFDCNHFDDKPDMSKISKVRDMVLMSLVENEHGVHRTLEYCFNICVGMADQFRQIHTEYEFRKEILFRKF